MATGVLPEHKNARFRFFPAILAGHNENDWHKRNGMASPKKPKVFAKPKPPPRASVTPKKAPIVSPPTEEEQLAALEKEAASEIKIGLEVLREIASGAGQYEPTERVAAAKALIAYGSSQIVHVRKVRSTVEKPQEKIAQLTLFDFPISQ